MSRSPFPDGLLSPAALPWLPAAPRGFLHRLLSQTPGLVLPDSASPVTVISGTGDLRHWGVVWHPESGEEQDPCPHPLWCWGLGHSPAVP